MQRRSPRLLLLAKAKAKLQAKARLQVKLTTPRAGGYLPRRSQRLKDSKKNAFKTYTSHISTVLDNLPVDVIKYNIFPYLDYETRNNLNSCLPVWDRLSTRMPRDSMEKHQTNCCVKMVDGILRSLANSNEYTGEWQIQGDARIQRMIQMLKLFLKDEYFFIYTHFPSFRSIFLAKIDEMWELANLEDHVNMYSRVWLDELISTCQALRNKILLNQGNVVEGYRFELVPLLTFN